jgi:hypothetical protein
MLSEKLLANNAQIEAVEPHPPTQDHRSEDRLRTLRMYFLTPSWSSSRSIGFFRRRLHWIQNERLENMLQSQLNNPF